jgi:hypothetical protein
VPDGTVTDNLTGLVWLENANCFGYESWQRALALANGLFDGSTNDPGGGDCGLSDGSVEGEWRLPNVRELQSLVHYGVHSPVVPDTSGTGQWSEGNPFSGLQLSYYWSSTTEAFYTVNAWYVYFYTGLVGYVHKTSSNYVWPVRGGQ